ncbi:MAG: VCBS repeat-containing protein, partial [Verrucomicrobiae bacterium]|nr:VCBS repeat-containing protein [Verrucomicrobiae bacterium]
ESPLSTDHWKRHVLDGPAAGKRLFVAALDIDNDKLLDIVAGNSWYKNSGKIGESWQKSRIGAGFENFMIAYDFDGDGDQDLLGTQGDMASSNDSNQFRLALNDGSGNFTLRADLPKGTGDFIQGIAAGRFQGNRIMVPLAWHQKAGITEALFVPDNPAKDPWELKLISPFSLNEKITPGDIDRDGDRDLLLGTAWLENRGDSWSDHIIGETRDLDPESEPDRNSLADINRDGRLDAVVVLEKGVNVLWFEQPENNPTGPWKRHIIGQSPGQGFSMAAVDMDRDGDIDVVVGEHRNPQNKNRLLFFENKDGFGQEWTLSIFDDGADGGMDHHDGLEVKDLDLDGDLDIISVGWKKPELWVYENQAIVK